MLAEIVLRFHQVFMDKSRPDDMALFVGQSVFEEDTNQVVTRLYFSPACTKHYTKLPLHYAITSCVKPDKEDLSLLVGPENAFKLIDRT